MSQFPHDQFAKDLLENLLMYFGKVETDHRIGSEVREIDVCFFPTSSYPTNLPSLGLLQKLASTGAAFEPFRNPVTRSEIRSCEGKLFDWHGELNRQANRERKAKPTEAELPFLWILTPTLAAETLTSFGAINEVETWGKGVYLLPPGQKTGIVVIHQLPETSETLWLRLLGKGKVQQRAIEEINQLAKDSPYRNSTLELLSDLKVVLEAKKTRDREDKELLMSLRTSPIYLQQVDLTLRQARERGLQEGRDQGLQEGRAQGLQEARQEGLQEARQEGLQEGQREIILKLLNHKFKNLPLELTAKVHGLSLDKLKALGEALLDFQEIEDLIMWLDENLS